MIPSAFSLNLNGTAGISQQGQAPVCSLKVNAKLQDVNFLLAAADPALSGLRTCYKPFVQ